MLHQHAQQFGIQLTQDTLWVLTLPLIDLAQVFPSLPQQFNLPARPQQGHGLGCCQQTHWHIGQHNRPLYQFPLPGVDGLALLMCLLFELLPSPLDHPLLD